MSLSLSEVEGMEREAKADLEALQRVRSILQRQQANQPANGFHKTKATFSAKESSAAAAVMAAIKDIPTTTFTVVDIFATLEKQAAGLNKSTVFNILRKLKSSGKVITVREGAGRRAAICKLAGADASEKEFIHGRRDSPEI